MIHLPMPRLARLDIASLLQHVFVRGIERRDIFNNDYDRQLFLDRFTRLISETGVRDAGDGSRDNLPSDNL